MQGPTESAQKEKQVPTNQRNSGILAAFLCYLIWGLFPLYFLLTVPASPLEIVAERVLFTLLFCAFLIPATRQVQSLMAVLKRPRKLLVLGAAGLLIFCNWLLYVIATTSHNVMEASLGYYINPIVSVALGVLFLGEKLRPLQWAGIAVAALAVLVMCVFYGSIPWLGLGLAFSFGLYGLLKKYAGAVPAVVSLSVETLVLAPMAAVLLAHFARRGDLTLFAEGQPHFWILAASGLVTAVPLLLFASAASRVPLSLIGMIQYLTPTMQFLLALFVTHETLTAGRWVGFGLIWVAAVFFIADSWRAQKPRLRT